MIRKQLDWVVGAAHRTFADVRKRIGHLPKEARVRDTWQYVKAGLKKAAAGGDAAQVSIALLMVLQLEKVECERK
jgi:hypothetical protein